MIGVDYPHMDSRRLRLTPLVCVVLGSLAFMLSVAYSEETSDTKSSIEIKPENIEKSVPSYNLSLKKLIEEAEKNIKKIDGDIKEREILKRNQEREDSAREHFEKGNRLYAEGKAEEAREEWQKSLDITKDPEMREYVRKSEERAWEEERARKKEEAARQEALAAEKKEAERLARAEENRLEAEARERARLERERQKIEEKARREAERIAREQANAEKAAIKEAERLARIAAESTK